MFLKRLMQAAAILLLTVVVAVALERRGRPGPAEVLLRRLQKGMPLSRVEVVEATWEEATGEFDGFRTRS